MSIQQHERTLEVWDRAVSRNNARVQGPVLCLSTGPLSREELSLIADDAYILVSVEEATEIAGLSFASVVVFADGLDLSRSLLEIGALDATGRIHWNLKAGLLATLKALDLLQLPFGVRVEGINHTDSGVVVTTAITPGGALDAESYRRGVEAGEVGASTRTRIERPTGDGPSQRETRALQEKLLLALQTMEPLIEGTPDCTRPHDGIAENELVLLKRKFDALDRKYTALATSRLGKLTLRLWARKRRPGSSSTDK